MKVRTNLAPHIVQVNANGILADYARDNLARLTNSVHHNLTENVRSVTAFV